MFWGILGTILAIIILVAGIIVARRFQDMGALWLYPAVILAVAVFIGGWIGALLSR